MIFTTSENSFNLYIDIRLFFPSFFFVQQGVFVQHKNVALRIIHYFTLNFNVKLIIKAETTLFCSYILYCTVNKCSKAL